jgi:hypothetical protein
MPWAEVFEVFVISHLLGDYLLQTEWQALNKRGGLTGTPTMRRALASHVSTYTLAYVPGLVWLWSSVHAGVFAIAAGVAIPHFIQDDGRLLASYARTFKKADITTNMGLGSALDQSFHLIALFITALIAGR